LLLQTGPNFTKIQRNNPDFYLVSDVEGSRPLRFDRAWVAVAACVGMVALIIARVDPLLAALAAVGVMVATRCISVADARQAVDWPVLVMIGASFGLGTALEKSGAARVIAGGLVDATRAWGPLATLAAIYFATMVLNELITNNGAAVLAFPFCLAAATELNVNPRPFFIAVALASSYAFASPIGYQTHMMVYGPGGYRFSDFVRVGLPLNLLLWVAAVAIIPLWWQW
jgi:di/tricarboxylate transporter